MLRLALPFFVLVGCVTPPPDASQEPDPPEYPRGVVDRVEAGPAAVLLTSQGDSRQLSLTMLDTAGDRISGDQVLWTSSAPAQVAVDAEGTVVATSAVGSAMVTAIVDGVASEPVLVTAVRLHPGTVLLDDAHVASETVLADPDITDDPLTPRVTVLRDAPALLPGELAVSREAASIGGEVLDVQVDGDDQIVTWRPMLAPELFDAFSLEFERDISRVQPIFDPWILENYDATVTDDGTWEFEPLEADEGRDASPNLTELFLGSCKITGDEDVPLLDGGVTLHLPSVRITPILDFNVRWTDLAPHQLTVVGGLEMQLSMGAGVTAALNLTFKCKKAFGTIPIPMPGPIGAAAAFTVSAGPGLQMKITPVDVEFGVDYSMSSQLTLEVGMRCPTGQPASCAGVWDGDLEHISPPELEVVVPEWGSLADALRLEPDVRLYGFLGFNMQAHVVTSRLRFVQGELLRLEAGVRGTASMARKKTQLRDTGYRNTGTVEAYVSGGLGAAIDNLTEVFGIVLDGGRAEVLLTLFQYPNGSVGDPGTIERGEPVNVPLTVTAGARALGAWNLEAIEVYELLRTESGVLDQVVLYDVLPVVAGQTDLVWTYTPAEDEADLAREFGFFIVPILAEMGDMEFANDARIILDPCGGDSNLLANGGFEAPEANGNGVWEDRGGATFTARHEEYHTVVPAAGTRMAQLGWERDAQQVYGILEQALPPMEAGTYRLTGKYNVLTNHANWEDQLQCQTDGYPRPKINLALGTIIATDWQVEDRPSRLLEPADYYCDRMDSSSVHGQHAANGWADLPITDFVLTEDDDAPFLFINVFGGLGWAEHLVFLDDLELRRIGSDCEGG